MTINNDEPLLYMPVGHLCVFFEDIYVHFLSQLLNGVDHITIKLQFPKMLKKMGEFLKQSYY